MKADEEVEEDEEVERQTRRLMYNGIRVRKTGPITIRNTLMVDTTKQ